MVFGVNYTARKEGVGKSEVRVGCWGLGLPVWGLKKEMHRGMELVPDFLV